jgi:hypothetical protein
VLYQQTAENMSQYNGRRVNFEFGERAAVSAPGDIKVCCCSGLAPHFELRTVKPGHKWQVSLICVDAETALGFLDADEACWSPPVRPTAAQKPPPLKSTEYVAVTSTSVSVAFVPTPLAVPTTHADADAVGGLVVRPDRTNKRTTRDGPSPYHTPTRVAPALCDMPCCVFTAADNTKHAKRYRGCSLLAAGADLDLDRRAQLRAKSAEFGRKGPSEYTAFDLYTSGELSITREKAEDLIQFNPFLRDENHFPPVEDYPHFKLSAAERRVDAATS